LPILSRQIRADLWLVLVTVIWGGTFVVVKNELANITPLAFVALRFAFAFVAMVAITGRSLARAGWREVAAGSLIGVFLFGGYAFQTVGLRYTTASKAAFITGLCVVLAPLFARFLLAHTPSLLALLGVGMATAGLALLSLTDELTLAFGDLLVLGCAISFALHIVAVSKFAPKMDPLALTTVQIGVVALAATGGTAVLEPQSALPAAATWGVAAFMGVVATAFAFTVQNRVQAITTPTHTALVLSLEPVFGALFACLLAGERLGMRELVGCGLILGGMVVAELRRSEQELRAAETVF
jgi:drug/metabolite transporter (DMT)-like permease